jgi:CRP/FNR family transcriptional regulator, cyclic AMP receptor protein
MAADQEIVQALNQTDLFGGVSKKGITAIANQARVVNHPAGREIVEEGGGAAAFHLIRSGTASVRVGDKSRPDLGPGDYFGEISLIDGLPRSATVKAESPLTTISLPSWNLHSLLDEHPEIARQLLKVMCARLRAAER